MATQLSFYRHNQINAGCIAIQFWLDALADVHSQKFAKCPQEVMALTHPSYGAYKVSKPAPGAALAPAILACAAFHPG